MPPGGALVTGSHAHDDYHLTLLVRASFFTSKQVKADRVDVETNARVVTLRGTVRSEAVKAEAVRLARSVEGVKQVRDELRVAPGGA